MEDQPADIVKLVCSFMDLTELKEMARVDHFMRSCATPLFTALVKKRFTAITESTPTSQYFIRSFATCLARDTEITYPAALWLSTHAVCERCDGRLECSCDSTRKHRRLPSKLANTDTLIALGVPVQNHITHRVPLMRAVCASFEFYGLEMASSCVAQYIQTTKSKRARLASSRAPVDDIISTLPFFLTPDTVLRTKLNELRETAINDTAYHVAAMDAVSAHFYRGTIRHYFKHAHPWMIGISPAALTQRAKQLSVELGQLDVLHTMMFKPPGLASEPFVFRPTYVGETAVKQLQIFMGSIQGQWIKK